MFAIYEPRVSTWPVQGWEPNSCLRTSKRQERQEPGRWTSSSQIQEDLQSQTEWQHLAPLFMVFLLHFTRQTFVGKVMSLLLNMLSRLLVTFLPRSKRFLISWLQSPSDLILERGKSKVNPPLSWENPGGRWRAGQGRKIKANKIKQEEPLKPREWWPSIVTCPHRTHGSTSRDNEGN